MNSLTYRCFYDGQVTDLDARSLYDAKCKAVAHFKAPKRRQSWVTVILLAQDGIPVVHSTSTL